MKASGCRSHLPGSRLEPSPPSTGPEPVAAEGLGYRWPAGARGHALPDLNRPGFIGGSGA
jgi:hypothetical protein